MRFRSAILWALLLSLIGTAQAQLTSGGIFEIWLKAREAADAPNDQKVTLYQKSKALVIGMDYDGRAWPHLSNGIRDAQEVAKALTAQGFQVTFKKDLKSRDLDDTLRDFFISEGSDPNARLLLWFAGHGDTIDGEAYLVPTDAPAPKYDSEFRLKAISLRRFGEYMREAKARHVLAIFDSCFSGGVFNVARSAPPPAITLATTQPVREFISSGEAEQQVSDDGTFRKLFLDVLAGKEPDADANHDGYVTGTELGLFLHQKMTNLTGNRQTPRYGKLNALGYDRGDFVFQVGKPDVPTTTAPEALSPSEAERAWAAVKDANRSGDLEAFLRRYGDSFYGDLARNRLEELKKNVAVVPQVAPASPQAPKAGEATRAWAAIKDTSRSTDLKAFLRRYGDSLYGNLARTRLGELKKSLVAVMAPPVAPTSQPPATSGPCGSAPVTVSLSSRSPCPLSSAEERALKPKDVFQECEMCPEMVVVPAGSFTMGSPEKEESHRTDESPQHHVTLSQPFAAGKFSVTFDEWDACVADGGCNNYRPNDQGWGRDRRPVIRVSWYDAKAYVTWLSRKTGKPYRLLTESEREYATRAGATTPFWWGSSISTSQANYTPKGEYGGRTLPVESFQPNPWGLYQMHGNVSEWVEDCYHDTYDGAPSDGSAWTGGDCKSHVIRGGSIRLDQSRLRAASRFTFDPGYQIDVVGFRLGRTLTP